MDISLVDFKSIVDETIKDRMKMMKWVTIIALLLMTSLIHAQGITVWAEKFPPYGYENESGEVVGLSTEIVKFLVEDSAINVDSWIVAPWARAFLETKKTPNTLLYTVVRKPEREKMFHWIGPISDRNQYLYKLKSRKDIVVSSINDAKKYVLGAVHETAVTKLLLSKGLKPTTVHSHDQTVKMLLLGRLDLAVHLDYSLAFIAKELGLKFSTFEPVLLIDSSKQYYIAVNKDSSPLIIEKLNTSFKKLEGSGDLTRIQQKYLQQ